MKIFNILALDNQIIKLNSSYMLDDKIIEIFVNIDDFCIAFSDQIKHFRLEAPNKGVRNRSCKLSDSKIMTIIICFHQSHYTNFKAFFCEMVCTYWTSLFPNLVSYDLMPYKLR